MNGSAGRQTRTGLLLHPADVTVRAPIAVGYSGARIVDVKRYEREVLSKRL